MNIGDSYRRAERESPATSPRGYGAKLSVRRLCAEHVGEARVLDLFCGDAGPASMCEAAWSDATLYLGVDRRAPGGTTPTLRMEIAAGLARIGPRIASFNVFDLDAYGCPWAAAIDVAARRMLSPGERVAFAVTDGLALALRLGSASAAALELDPTLSKPAPRSAPHEAARVGRMCSALAARMNATVTRIAVLPVTAAQRGRKGGGVMVYAALLIEGS